MEREEAVRTGAGLLEDGHYPPLGDMREAQQSGHQQRKGLRTEIVHQLLSTGAMLLGDTLEECERATGLDAAR